MIIDAIINFESVDISYILGLLSSGYILSITKPDVFGGTTATFTSGTCSCVISGLLVGFGSRLGSGCTSGHGICGLPRLSLRSLAAVMTFMTTGALSSYCTRQYRIPVNSVISFTSWEGPITENILPYMLPTAVAVTVAYLFKPKSNTTLSISRCISSFASALVFGLGLGISGMLNPQRVIKFLDFTDEWDPSLMSVMSGGVMFNIFSFYYLKKNSKKIKYSTDPANMKIDFPLVAGSAIFGLGWGFAGNCPGPSLVGLGGGVVCSKYFVASMISGMLISNLLKRDRKNEIKSN